MTKMKSIQSLTFAAALAAVGLVAVPLVGCGTDEGNACAAAQNHIAACSQSLTLDSCTAETAAEVLATPCEDIAAAENDQRTTMSEKKTSKCTWSPWLCNLFGVPTGSPPLDALQCDDPTLETCCPYEKKYYKAGAIRGPYCCKYRKWRPKNLWCK